jgi:hypothetical protein
MSNILNCLVNFGFSLFGCNQREKNTVCVKGILTCILKYGAQFNEDSQPILIELADMSVALKGGDRRKLEKEKEGFDTDAWGGGGGGGPPPPLLLYYFLYMYFTQRRSQSITSTNMLRAVRF